MKTPTRIAATVLGFFALALPASFAFADAASISIQSLLPGTSVLAKERLTFTIAPTGFLPQTYQFSDSFPGTTASLANIDGGGHFFWAPLPSDAGMHTFTITATDVSGTSAQTTQTITVLPPPSLSVQAVSPGTSVMPGARFSFSISALGFTNPTFSVSDSFSGSSATNPSTIDRSGNFAWTPDQTQNGDHAISVYAYDAAGHSASVTQAVRVGQGPSLSVTSLLPGTSVSYGTTTSFTVVPLNFLPTAFSVGDSFPGSTISNNNISISGAFSWMPQASDAGVHTITVTGTVGTFGQSASTTQVITVLGPGGVAPAAGNTSSTLVASLQAQLSALLASKAQASASGSAQSSSGTTFNAYLKPGSQGDEVTRLQSVLAQQGFFSATPNGLYGPVTTAAVIKFQAAHGLGQLGVVGPATRAALNALSSGTASAASTTSSPPAGDGYVFKNFMGLGEDVGDGPDVMELQKRLATLGFFSGDTTGYFGPATAAAVKKFQTARGITATGYVGPDTRAALNQ